MSNQKLKEEITKTLKAIDLVIEDVKKTAGEHNIDPLVMRDYAGNWICAPLLVAKSQCLNSLAILIEGNIN